jgi:hypothetical protein
MTKKEEQAVLVFERKIFRRIYGPKYENGEWKIRTKRELEEMSKGENIVKWIKGQRTSWLGHLERMEENRMPKMIFSQELEGPYVSIYIYIYICVCVCVCVYTGLYLYISTTWHSECSC